MKKYFLLMLMLVGAFAFAQQGKQKDTEWEKKFEQLGTTLPTPNTYRTASGAPGHQYWQQQADYDMQVTLDDDNQTITGSETITYYNNSPDDLAYLWVQLDQNIRAPGSDYVVTASSEMADEMNAREVFMIAGDKDFVGGFNIKSVSSNGRSMSYTINKTMMRIDLDEPLKAGNNLSFNIEWMFNINNRMDDDGRSGLEYFEDEDNYLYTMAQFFPRMAVYIDNEGWQNKQFLGDGEFALTFGNYKVSLTVPSDFIVGATGTLSNPGDVLTATQMERYEKAKSSYDKPVFIITEKEARANEKTKAKGTKTWTFEAENVRDFAFCASRKFMWDAMAVKLSPGNEPLAMSYYPKEGNPLWEQWSTLAVAQALETYSRHTIEYPYPVAISVHTADQGMEYPMICFNYGRPNEDGSYTEYLKQRTIGVIIHEVGHNFFPMIINSDERQWTWMDEGLNTFVQYLTEQEFGDKYLGYKFPSRRGEAYKIIPYMSGEDGLVRPIMTNSEQVRQLGSNAYAKPATALNILREVVMGPDLFDKAFKTYAERWAFKHPTPADLFRTMEDASAVDLDWFWRGWFYGTDNVDISIDKVRWYQMRSEENALETRNIKGSGQAIDGANDSEGFSSDPQFFEFVDWEGPYDEYRQKVKNTKIRASVAGKQLYELTFKNVGGLVTPLLIEWTYADGSVELEKIPAEVWRINEKAFTKVFVKEKQVSKIVLDPKLLTADTDVSNNVFPRSQDNDRFERFKNKKD